jgi:glycosyltransferase involved in cell wall biosynthesis
MEEGSPLELSVIMPARNEQDALPACLESLLAQSEPGWELGREWELVVVDDASTDDTRRIVAAMPGVALLEAPKLDTSAKAGFTGKTNACWAGAQAARGKLLLFTDADTIHEPGSLSRARHELEKYEVAMLSYSPRQLTTGFLQRILMPLVFAELAIAYPMKRVNLPEDRIAAANGQFLMVEADAYFAVGGHRGVGREVLEDVALASAIKRSRRGLRFRYAPDALSTRMYRTTSAMMEGWTKNLALLFSSPILLAMMRLLDFLLIVLVPVIALRWPFLTTLAKALLWVVWLRVLWRFYARTAKSNFSPIDCAISFLGLPLLILLLIRSTIQVKVLKAVEWKGRSYKTGR